MGASPALQLAPAQFDYGLREQLEREREERERWDADCSAALAKVYGVNDAEAAEQMRQARENQRCGNGAETVQFPRRKAEAIERWFCEWEGWLALGREMMARHRRVRPHQRVGLGTIARLVEMAGVFARLSTGLRPFS